MLKRILVVSHDAALRHSRSALLMKSGYAVETAQGAYDALNAMLTGRFDLVLVGRNSLGDRIPMDQQLREKYPDLLILKIIDLVELSNHSNSYASQLTDAVPINVIAALKGMLG